MGIVLNENEWKLFMENNRSVVFSDKPKAWRSLKNGKKALDIMDSYSKAICLDTETTGLTHKDQIIQFSAIKVTLPEMYEMDRMDIYIRPDKPVSPVITQITGITNEFLNTQKTEKEVFDEIRDFIGGAPLVIAYNAPFDCARLKDLYQRNGDDFEPGDVLDVMEMAKDLVQPDMLIQHDGGRYDDGKPHYKQEFVAPLLHADEGLQFHSAIDDTVAVMRLLRIFTEQYKCILNAKEKTPKEKVEVKSAYYWENPYMKSMQRVRVMTSVGEVYLDCYTKQWNEPKNKKSKGIIDFIDMEDMENKVFRMWHVSSLKELISVSRAIYKKRKREKESQAI